MARRFCDGIRLRVSAESLSKSLTPGQQVIRAVHEELVGVLGGETLKITYASRPPTVVLMAGLQGSGKTTASAKLAQWWKQQGRNPILVGADLQRPAAVEQLRILGAAGRGHGLQRADRTRWPRQGRSRRGPAPGQGRLHHRHRRPPDHRRRPHGGDPRHLGCHRAALHLLGHRRHDRPGRGGHRAGLPRHARHSTPSSCPSSTATPAVAPPSRSRAWSASPSPSPAPASAWTTSTSSIPTAWPTASSAWATCSA